MTFLFVRKWRAWLYEEIVASRALFLTNQTSELADVGNDFSKGKPRTYIFRLFLSHCILQGPLDLVDKILSLRHGVKATEYLFLIDTKRKDGINSTKHGKKCTHEKPVLCDILVDRDVCYVRNRLCWYYGPSSTASVHVSVFRPNIRAYFGRKRKL